MENAGLSVSDADVDAAAAAAADDVEDVDVVAPAFRSPQASTARVDTTAKAVGISRGAMRWRAFMRVTGSEDCAGMANHPT